MKRFFILFFVFVLTSICFAQDVIVKKDGTVLNAKVLTIEETIITYKKWENLEGPSYTLKKDDIYSIMYANGTKEIFQQNAEEKKETQNSLVIQQSLPNNINKVKSPSVGGTGVGEIIGGWCLIGLIGVPGIAGGVLALCNDAANIGAYMVPIGAVGLGVGIAMVANGRSRRQKAYEMYHSSIKLQEYNVGKYKLAPSVDMYTNPITMKQSYGGGLCLKF